MFSRAPSPCPKELWHKIASGMKEAGKHNANASSIRSSRGSALGVLFRNVGDKKWFLINGTKFNYTLHRRNRRPL